jgi:WXG100 family type VII secretion target
MVRRTVQEGELLDVADELHRFCTLMSARLDSVAAGLTSLRDDWEGIAFDAFLERVHGWQQWAEEMTDAVSDMKRNAHIAHGNYEHNAEVNTSMWGG